MIKQIHVSECDSTQDVLKEQLNNFSSEDRLVVSCEHQRAGRGRGTNNWKSLSGTLCFSMNIEPHAVMSFTAIELSVLVARYFSQKGKSLKLKWPNDLWNEEQKKCGGILIQGSQNVLLAGIGINLFSEDNELGGIFQEVFSFDKAQTALDLANYIHQNRFTDTNLLKREWLLNCGHLNQFVKIIEGEEVSEGMFQGIGDFGEALVCIDSKVKKFYNGSLRLS
jgi:BirA family biotin operon repressor/biotin-[acetyl-CoA-carboxylase] ligase